MDTKIIILHKGVLKSWLSDTGTFISFTITMATNYFLFDNNGVSMFFLIVLWFTLGIAKAKGGNSFYDKKSAIDYINSL